MPTMTTAEKALTRSYGLLSSRVSEALGAVCRTGDAALEANLRAFESGQEFLDQLIVGSRFIEGQKLQKGELAPRPDTIKAFQHAFLTLQHLSRLHENATVSKALQQLRNELVHVRETSASWPLASEEVENLRMFFATLTSYLADDLARQRLEGAAPLRPSREEDLIDDELPT